MTNEEARGNLMYALKWSDMPEKKALKIAIKALDNEGVLNKIRAEIEEKFEGYDICEYFENYDYEENDISEYRPIGNIADILQIIDKYSRK